ARKLDDVVKTERQGIERDLQGRERDRRRQALEQIPPDAAGRLRELQNYDFHDEQAEQKFQDLLASLRAQAMQPFMQGMQNALGNMSPEDLKRMREMIQDLNRMLRERAEGGEPDFEKFKQKWDEQLGLDEAMRLMEEMQKLDALEQELRATRSLEDLAKLSPEDVAKVAGEEAARDLERLQEIAKRLKDAGYLEGEDDDLKLTAR